MKRHAPEQVIAMLKEADVRLAHGERVSSICDNFGISEQTYYRWRRTYGGLSVDQVQYINELKRENTKLRKVVSNLTLDLTLLRSSRR